MKIGTSSLAPDCMNTKPIRESYDRLADEYARRLFGELQHKPVDQHRSDDDNKPLFECHDVV